MILATSVIIQCIEPHSQLLPHHSSKIFVRCLQLEARTSLEHNMEQSTNICDSNHKITESLKCPKCGKEFSTKHYYHYHIKYIHSDSRESCCTECNRSFKSIQNLILHFKRMHNTHKSHHCHKCSSSFGLQNDLTAHLKRHENNKEWFPILYITSV